MLWHVSCKVFYGPSLTHHVVNDWHLSEVVQHILLSLTNGGFIGQAKVFG